MNTGRQTRIESTYKVHIPGQPLGDRTDDTWHPFLMSTNEILGLYQAIKETLNLT